MLGKRQIYAILLILRLMLAIYFTRNNPQIFVAPKIKQRLKRVYDKTKFHVLHLCETNLRDGVICGTERRNGWHIDIKKMYRGRIIGYDITLAILNNSLLFCFRTLPSPCMNRHPLALMQWTLRAPSSASTLGPDIDTSSVAPFRKLHRLRIFAVPDVTIHMSRTWVAAAAYNVVPILAWRHFHIAFNPHFLFMRVMRNK